MEKDIEGIKKMLNGIQKEIGVITTEHRDETYVNTEQVVKMLGYDKYKSGVQMFRNLCKHKDEAKRFPKADIKSTPNWWKRQRVVEYIKEQQNGE